MHKIKCLCIDGEIGAGKSTLIERLEATPAVISAVLGPDRFLVPVLECVPEWQSTGIFALMITDPVEWAEAFQHVAMVTRITSWIAAHRKYADDPRACLLLERTPQADRYIFTRQHAALGNITPEQERDHGRWYEKLWAKRPSEIDRVGMLICDDFDEIARRIFKERARTDEDHYRVSYLRSLHDRYANMAESEEWPLHAVTTLIDAKLNFRECDRALYLCFARLCGTQPDKAADFECNCGAC